MCLFSWEITLAAVFCVNTGKLFFVVLYRAVVDDLLYVHGEFINAVCCQKLGTPSMLWMRDGNSNASLNGNKLGP